MITEDRFRKATEHLEKLLSGHSRAWLVEPGFAPSEPAREALEVVVQSWGAVPGYSASESAVVVLTAPVGPRLAPRAVVRASWLFPGSYALADAFHSRHAALVLGAPSCMLPQARATSHAEIVKTGVEVFRSAFRSTMRRSLVAGAPDLTEKLLAHSSSSVTYGRSGASAISVVTDPITLTHWVVCVSSPVLPSPATFDGYLDQETAFFTAEKLSRCGDELVDVFKWARGPLVESLERLGFLPPSDPQRPMTFEEVARRIEGNPAAAYLAGEAFLRHGSKGPVVPSGYRVVWKSDCWDWEKSGSIPVQVPAEVYEALAYAIRNNRRPRHEDEEENR